MFNLTFSLYHIEERFSFFINKIIIKIVINSYYFIFELKSLLLITIVADLANGYGAYSPLTFFFLPKKPFVVPTQYSLSL